MFSRQEELSELQNYIKEAAKEVTMILQSLQWERKQLLQYKPKSTCKFDSGHRVPQELLEEHEAKCALKCQGYAKNDVFLPDVFDANSNTVLKLSSENIKDIINYASKTDPVFIRVTVNTNNQFFLAVKKCDANVASEPLTLERLQATYSADERRAIYDAVVHSRPSCGELADLAVGEVGGPSQPQNKTKSELERLAELRDLRRRRAKYRVAVRSRNYSHILRGVIDAQMEMLTESRGHTQSKLLDESNNTYRKVKEEQSIKCIDNPSDRNSIEHREFTKKGKDDNDRRNNYDGDNNRKRDYDGHKSSRKKEKDRYQYSTDERGKQYNSYRRHERKQETYRGEVEKDLHQNLIKEKGKHYDSDRRQERNRDTSRIKIEKDVHQSTTEDRGKYISNDEKRLERHRDANREREKYYDGGSRQLKKHDTCREEMDSRIYGTSSNAESNRIYIKEERDSSSSMETQKFNGHRESEREKRSYEYKDRSNDRRRSEHKQYDDYEKYKKERENYHREKRKHKD